MKFAKSRIYVDEKLNLKIALFWCFEKKKNWQNHENPFWILGPFLSDPLRPKRQERLQYAQMNLQTKSKRAHNKPEMNTTPENNPYRTTKKNHKPQKTHPIRQTANRQHNQKIPWYPTFNLTVLYILHIFIIYKWQMFYTGNTSLFRTKPTINLYYLSMYFTFPIHIGNVK